MISMAEVIFRVMSMFLQNYYRMNMVLVVWVGLIFLVMVAIINELCLGVQKCMKGGLGNLMFQMVAK